MALALWHGGMLLGFGPPNQTPNPSTQVARLRIEVALLEDEKGFGELVRSRTLRISYRNTCNYKLCSIKFTTNNNLYQ